MGGIGPNPETVVTTARSVGTGTRKGKGGEMESIERAGREEAGGINDASSIAYWCRAEPHRPFSIPSVEERVPRQG